MPAACSVVLALTLHILLSAQAFDALTAEVASAAEFHRLHLHLGAHGTGHEPCELLFIWLRLVGRGRRGLILTLHLIIEILLSFLLLWGKTSQLTKLGGGRTVLTGHHARLLQTSDRVGLVRLDMTTSIDSCSVLKGLLLLCRMRTFLVVIVGGMVIVVVVAIRGCLTARTTGLVST